MRKMKRFVSIILAATMLLTSMNALPFSSVAFAEEPAGETTLTLVSTTDRLSGKAMSDYKKNNAVVPYDESGTTHEMLTLVNAPILENLDAYVGRTYGIFQLGEAFKKDNVYLLAKPEALSNVGLNSASKTVSERYTETTAGEALYSFVAPDDGIIYTLSNIDMSATYTDDAGDVWTVLNDGKVPYGPDGVTLLDNKTTYQIRTADEDLNRYDSYSNLKMTDAKKGNTEGSTKGVKNFSSLYMPYAALIPSTYTPTAVSDDSDKYKYYATMVLSGVAALYNDTSAGIEQAYANGTDGPIFAYTGAAYDSNPSVLRGVYALSYCYSLTFEAGDTVNIPCYPTTTSSVGAVNLVKWGNPDATLSTLSYTVDGETKTVDGFETTDKSGTYDVTLEPGTKKINFNAVQTQTTKADMAITLADGTEIASGAEILLAPNKTKTVTVTVTAENGDVNTYTVNFVAPVEITWIEENNTYTYDPDTPADTTDDVKVTLWEYVEGDKFSPGDAIYVNRGGSQDDNTDWHATAVGNGLRGLDYIRGRDLGKARATVTSAQIKNQVTALANAKTPIYKFTASSSGVVYAVSNGAVANLTDASKQPDGIAWTALTADADGHTNNGTFDIDHTKQGDDYTAFTNYIAEQAEPVADTLINYLCWMYPKKTATDAHPILSAAFIKNETLWPNSLSVADKPYGFATVADESAGLNPGQPKFGYAYKKAFSADEEVTIPAWYAGIYSPMYFIEWKISDNAEIKSVSYTVNGAATPVTATPDFTEASTGVYTAEVELAFDAENISGITANPKDANATVAAIGDFEFGETEFSKTVTTTVTSEDGKNTYTYNITFTRPKWDYTNTTFTVSDKTYYLAKYIEGNTFGPTDCFVMERGGAGEGSTKWQATTVGEKLMGLDYIVGRRIDVSGKQETSEAWLDHLKNNELPMMSFRADSDGILYAVSYSSLDSVYLSASEKVGGAWESLHGKDNHVNGASMPPVPSTETGYTTWLEYANDAAYADIMATNEEAAPHKVTAANAPYGFYSFYYKSDATEGTNKIQGQYTFTRAYRKKFYKGDVVHIPSPGAVKFTPVYLIKWTTFSDDNTAALTFGGKPVDDKATVEIEFDETAEFVVTPNGTNATVAYDKENNITTENLAAGASVTITATVTAENGTTKDYTITVTRKYNLSELIKGFSYKANNGNEVETTFAALDDNKDGSYSKVIDIWLDAGTTSVEISDILSFNNVVEYNLDVTPALTEGTTTVDVSGGKGTVEFYATYEDKVNYYIVRFMVAAPAITDFENLFTNETAKTNYQFVNKPMDNLDTTRTDATLAVDTRSPYIEGTYQKGYPFAYLGSEINNSYLLVRHTRNQAGSYTSAAENTPEEGTAPEYMYTFTAPADMKVIVAGYTNADSTSKYREANTDWKYVGSSVGNDGLDTTQYTYKNTNFWHLANTNAKTHTYASGAITGATDGIPAIYTKPQDYLVSKPYASMHWVNADGKIQGAYKTYKVANPTEFEDTWADNKSNSLDWLDMVSDWKTAPTYGEKPLYVEANNFMPIGYQSPVGEIAYVYTQNFTSGSTVNIPFWYMTAKTGGANRNPVIYVQYEYAFSSDNTAKSLTYNGNAEDLETKTIEKTVDAGTDISVVITAKHYDATVKYTVDGAASETGTITNIEDGEHTIEAIVVAENGDENVYTFNIEARAVVEDLLIKSFDWKGNNDADATTVYIADRDIEPLGSQIIDIIVPAGTKSVTLSNVKPITVFADIQSTIGTTAFDTSTTYTVDVSKSKGEAVLTATLGDKTNKYILRFATAGYKAEQINFATDYGAYLTYDGTPLSYKTSGYGDASTYTFAYMGEELYNTHVLAKPSTRKKNSLYVGKVIDETAGTTIGENANWFSFNAPEDGTLYMVLSTEDAMNSKFTDMFTRVSGSSNALTKRVTNYKYEKDTWWHKTGSVADQYSYKKDAEGKHTYNSNTYTITASGTGIQEILTHPYNYLVPATPDYGYSENYLFSTYLPFDTAQRTLWKSYIGETNNPSNNWLSMITEYENDPQNVEAPKYIDSNDAAEFSGKLETRQVYKYGFDEGDTVNVPIVYTADKSSNQNPIILVKWAPRSNDTKATSLTYNDTEEDIGSTSFIKDVEAGSNVSVVITPADYKASVKYTKKVGDGEAEEFNGVIEGISEGTTIITAQVVAEDGTLGTAYTFTITAKSNALIKGFSYSYGESSTGTVNFMDYDNVPLYSQYFDVDVDPDTEGVQWLPAGTKSVTIGDVTQNDAYTGINITVTPSDNVVDVSTGKGEVTFEATYTDPTTSKTITNKYIARFMVDSYDFAITSPMTKGWTVYNKPFDYFSGTSLFTDRSTWNLGQVGSEIQNSYLLIRPVKDVYTTSAQYDKESVYLANNTDKTAADAAAAEYYMYSFTAPADGVILLASSADTAIAMDKTTGTEYVGNIDEIAAAGFVKVMGNPVNVNELNTYVTDYTYTHNSFWHKAGTELQAYTKSGGVITKRESFDGVTEIITKPYDHQVTAVEDTENYGAENYYVSSYHIYDTSTQNAMVNYKKQYSYDFEGTPGTANAAEGKWVTSILKSYRDDPTIAKPAYIEANECAAPGLGATYVTLGTVYKKAFKAGETVNIPFYYAKPGSGGYNPVVFVQWKGLDTNVGTLAEASLKADISGSVPREVAIEDNGKYELGYNDTSLTLHFATNNHKDFIKYEINNEPGSNVITPTEEIPSMKVTVTIMSEAAAANKDGGAITTYTFTVSKAVDKTDYGTAKNIGGTAGDSIAIEAEGVFIDETDGATDSGTEVTLNGFGIDDVHVPNDKYGNDGAKINPEAPGNMGFELAFDEAGAYTIWVRYKTDDNTDKAAWVDYGEVAARTAVKGYGKSADGTATTFAATNGAYAWQAIKYMHGVPETTKRIRIRAKDDGLTIDKFVITRNLDLTTYTPNDDGTLPESVNLVASLANENPKAEAVVTPPTPPANEHPRVLFKSADIPQIKKNLLAAENAALVSAYESKRNDTAFDGKLANKDPNYNAEKLEIIAAKAFDYAIFKDDADETVKARALANGNAAIELIKNYAATLQVDAQGDNCRQKGHVLKNIGQVYDWCYDLLDADDQKELMYLAQMLSAGMEIGFPPNKQGILSGHGAEWQVYRDWLTMAIACYDEYPDVYNFIAPNVYSAESVSYRNWWYQSGTQSQGTSYGPGRLEPELYAHVLIKKMGGGELFNEEAISNVPFEWIYRRRPDGQMMIDGDDNTPNTTKFGNYAYNALSRDVLLLAYTLNGDEILKQEYIKQGGLTATYGREAIQPVEALILNKPSIKTNTPKNTLPLTTYHAYPVGEMVARTGWDIESGVNSKDVIATMTLNATNPTNHGHYEAGHFMIYYKGILANDSGWYEEHSSDHHKNYMSQSVAHNTLVIETTKNPYGNQNQGIDHDFYWIPESWSEYNPDSDTYDKDNTFAEILAHEFGPDAYEPEYTYLAGDLAPSYNISTDDNKEVNEALRHMIFLPTGNEDYPAAFVVFDKIDTVDAGKKKAFLLHSQEEPTVSGNVTTIKRTERGYNGKLVNQTLLPESSNLTINTSNGGAIIDTQTGKVSRATDVEGEYIDKKADMPDNRFNNKGEKWLFMQDNPEFVQTKNTIGRVVNPDNSLEAGWGRVEIMPTTSSATDYMLNVMYVGSADETGDLQTATKIESGNFIGAQIFDRVVMFNTDKARTENTVTFAFTGTGTFKVNVAGLAAGAWTVADGAGYSTTKIVSNDGGILYFDNAPAGTYTLTKTEDTLTLKINGEEYVGATAIDQIATGNIELAHDVETINLVLESTDGAEVTYTVDDAAVAEVKDIPAPLMGGSKTVKATVDGATYTFTFTRGTMTASVTVSAHDSNTVDYKLADDATYTNGDVEFTLNNVTVGTKYTFKAKETTGYTFKYWEIDDYIVSEDIEYTYTVSKDVTINAVFAEDVVIDAKTVIFKNRNGKILEEGGTLYRNSMNTITPPTPIQNGYTFKSWLRKDTGEEYTDLGELKFDSSELDDATTIVFEAQYSKATTKYEVVVNNGYIYYANDVAVGNTTTENAQYEYNTPIIVRPTDESNFSYWIKDDKIASYSPVYKFHVTTAASTTLKAVYDGTEGEEAKPKPFISVTNLVLDEDNTKIRFYTERYVPTGYTFIGAGLTVTKDKPGLGNCNNLSGSGIYQWTSKNPNARQFVGTKANIGTGHTWYAKAWLMYKKPDSDHIYTIYSTEESITY
ncbi:MAG: hypothetical protein E7410_03860 [Ruminococcaceae bacterium]|nr:hypothetical protein [Oscillospiraceae bacterium]